MKRIRIIPVRRGKRYECFDCRTEVVLPYDATRCPWCGEEDNFYLMN